eukprot:TRINITY_DN5856_c0_g1_i1.p1 TRINITY_DN5856_c0_g1~~TRINITY_DN5856_c0_g1_i1.p1  ORF type:complete len:299 (-),score=57.31 TRINITY_DN5856_c0_g1_i1:21-917(-)
MDSIYERIFLFVLFLNLCLSHDVDLPDNFINGSSTQSILSFEFEGESSDVSVTVSPTGKIVWRYGSEKVNVQLHELREVCGEEVLVDSTLTKDVSVIEPQGNGTIQDGVSASVFYIAIAMRDILKSYYPLFLEVINYKEDGEININGVVHKITNGDIQLRILLETYEMIDEKNLLQLCFHVSADEVSLANQSVITGDSLFTWSDLYTLTFDSRDRRRDCKTEKKIQTIIEHEDICEDETTVCFSYHTKGESYKIEDLHHSLYLIRERRNPSSGYSRNPSGMGSTLRHIFLLVVMTSVM